MSNDAPQFGGRITSAWLWTPPRDGEVVPDFPPIDLLDYVADSQFEGDDPDPAAGPCGHCERCTWNPGADCGRPEHPHCPTCGHCNGRHR